MITSFCSSFILLLIALFSYQTNATPEKVEQVRKDNIANERRLMSQSATARDSLIYFFNIFDLSTNEERRVFLDSIIGTAGRAENREAQFELIRLYASLRQPAELREKLLAIARSFPPSEKRDETIAFVRMRDISIDAYSKDAGQLESELQEVIKTLEKNPPSNKYERLTERHRACVLLSLALRGDIIKDYFNKYLEEVETLPADVYSIRNAAYVQACAIYNNSGDYADVIKYNKKLLHIIDTLVVYYKDHDRPFRNYYYTKYIRYLSMLRAYKGLAPDELDHIYAEVLRMKDMNTDVRNSINRMPLAVAYYYFAKGDYRIALPYLKTACNDEEFSQRRLQLLEMLIKCASNVGDTHTLESASEEYVKAVRKFIDDRSFETYRKLQIKMDISEIRNDKEKLIKDIQEQKLENAKKRGVAFTAAIIIITIILTCVLYLYIKNNRLTKKLVEVNEFLTEDRDKLKTAQSELLIAKEEYEKENKIKTDFIAGIRHTLQPHLVAVVENSRLIVDCTEGSGKPYLMKFANTIEHNIKIIQTIISDVFTLTELHNSDMTINYSGINVNKMCDETIDTMSALSNQNVDVRFIKPEDCDDLIITTDPQRVERVLINLILNGIKFTEKGEVTLTYRMDDKRKNITFIITDTGIGIPPSKAEVIFERFVKLNRHEPGLGIGLTIARMVADLLQGSIRLDTTYKDGARFLFTIPVA